MTATSVDGVVTAAELRRASGRRAGRPTAPVGRARRPAPHRSPYGSPGLSCVAMPYPTKLLNDNETVVLDLHPHWWYFVEAAVALVVAIVLGIVALVVGWPSGGEVGRASCSSWPARSGCSSATCNWLTTNFVVTSDRVIFRHGVFAKAGIEIPLERVNSVHFNQGFIERILGAGDLLIESGAESGQQRFTDVKQPRPRHRTPSTSRWTSTRTRCTAGAGRRAGTDVATQLEKLEGMLQRGTLTREEFEDQKRKLLGLTVAVTAPRVVSLVPSATETLLALGADVVACTRFCEQPDLPHVGGTKNPDVAADRRPRARPRRRRRGGEPARGRRGARRRPASSCSSLAVRDRSTTRSPRSPSWPPRAGRPAPDAARAAAAGGRAAAGVRADLAAAVDDDQRRHVRGVGAAGRRRRARHGRRWPDRYPTVELADIAALAPDVVLVPSEPYAFTDAHVDELRGGVPERRGRRASTARTCSGGAPARRAPSSALRPAAPATR